MRIIKDLSEINKLHIENTIIALGKFDGIHKGHREIMNRLLRDGKTKGYTSLVFTFSGNPALAAEDPAKQDVKGEKLFTGEEQLLFYERLGIDIVIIYPLNSGILGMEPESFASDVLKRRLGVKKIICGENFRFGKNRAGDVRILKGIGDMLGFETEVVPMLKEGGSIISSTAIRELIRNGRMEEACAMLGHRYIIVGRVVHGNEIGRTLDTPTANIIPDRDKLLPPYGVYVSVCNIDGRQYRGVTNIGVKPTVKEEEKRTGVETFFLDCSRDLYGRILELELISYIRPEKKFESLSELKEQLKRDKERCRLTAKQL